MPNGRGLPLLFGMYTRRVGRARQGRKLIRASVSRPRAFGVLTSTLSTPAVRFPAFCWVTRHTPTSVLA